MIKLRLYLILLLSAIVGCCATFLVYAETQWNFVPAKQYLVHFTDTPLVIDGKANEDIWADVNWSDKFVDIEGDKKPQPYFDTRVKMLWDEQYLYFYTELEEQHIWADITERDQVIFYNNDFEIFIKPSLLDTQYAEFEVNALGTVWDLLLFNTYRHDVPIINQWDMKGVKLAIDIDGTLNDPRDIDRKWSIEIALPLKDLAEVGGRSNLPKEGTQWLVNFSRVQWQHELKSGVYQRKKGPKGKFLPENNWVWSPQGIIAMHQPETWGSVQFTKKRIGKARFMQDEHERVKQALFYLYRQQLSYFKQNQTYATQVEQLVSVPFSVNSEVLIPVLSKTSMGYEITITDPISDVSYVINHESKLMKL